MEWISLFLFPLISSPPLLTSALLSSPLLSSSFFYPLRFDSLLSPPLLPFSSLLSSLLFLLVFSALPFLCLFPFSVPLPLSCSSSPFLFLFLFHFLLHCAAAAVAAALLKTLPCGARLGTTRGTNTHLRFHGSQARFAHSYLAPVVLGFLLPLRTHRLCHHALSFRSALRALLEHRGRRRRETTWGRLLDLRCTSGYGLSFAAAAALFHARTRISDASGGAQSEPSNS